MVQRPLMDPDHAPPPPPGSPPPGAAPAPPPPPPPPLELDAAAPVEPESPDAAAPVEPDAAVQPDAAAAVEPDAAAAVQPVAAVQPAVVQPAAQLAVPQLHEPAAGWSVEAFHYYTVDAGHVGPVENWGYAAHMFLARDNSPSRSPAGVQWWYGNNEPTPFHGIWQMGRGSLVAVFNCRGASYPDGSPRRLLTTRLRRASSGIYYGEDERNRKVKVESYGKWLVSEDPNDGNRLVWIASEELDAM